MGLFRESTLAHNAAWMFLGQGLSIALQCVYFMLLGRLLGSMEYGIYVGATALAAILGQYSVLGSGWVFLQYVSPNHSQFSRYWGNILASTFGVGSILVIVLSIGGPHIAHSYSWLMLACVGVGDCICMQLVSAIGCVFQAFEKMRLTALVNILVNGFRVVLVGGLFNFYRHIDAFQWAVAALVVSLVAVCAAVVMVTWHYGKPTFSWKLWKRRTEEGFIFSLSSSTDNVYSNFDKVLLGHYGMHMANGVYSMAYKAVCVAFMPALSIQMAAVPRIFQRGNEGVKGTSRYVLRIMKSTVPVGLVMSALIWLAAPLCPLLVGKSFTQSISAMQWLCLLPFTRVLQFSAGDALTGAGLQRYRLGTQIVAAVLNLSMNLYLIPRHGWLGAAWASVATDGTLAVMNWAILLTVRRREIAEAA